MKQHLSLIAALILSPAPFIFPAVASETQQAAAEVIEIEPELKDYARGISVKINGESNGGSGVMIGKQENKYLVITNNHVISGSQDLTIQTADGQTHQADIVNNPITSDDDIALLTFSSNNNYQVANLNSAATGKAEQQILAVGYSAETGELVFREGTIARIPHQPLKEGYQIGYTSDIVSGMSGGAILNIFGDLIGINGISAFPILSTAYEYEDGTTPPKDQIERYRQLSWGLSLNHLLSQLNPDIITAYSLPLPETLAETENTELTGWLAELEATAKQITVRIDSSSGANGSGIIVAKEGNTYAVLTADHVICEKDDETRKCIDYNYEIVAPDGKKYPLDSSTFRRQEGVDLAVVRFSSDEDYQVAELANYPVANGDAVFVAGYPQTNNNAPPQWKFSLGYGWEREQGLLRVNDSSLSTDSSGLISSSGSLAGGYEMVYTSITYGGMSGGAVLDREGRVIGIHGLAEGATALDSQNSTVKRVQLGNSLGVPVNTFIGLLERFEIDSELPIQDSRPRDITSAEQEAFKAAILGTEIPQGNAKAEEWLERGNRLWRLNRQNEAVKAFDKAIALNPEFVHLAYYGKGIALWYGERNESALSSLNQATKLQPDFSPAFARKSTILRELNKLDEALLAIEKAITLQSNDANLYLEKGTIMSSLKRYKEAEMAYNQAIQISSRSAFHFNRGNFYKKQGKLDLALADYNQAINLNPNDGVTYVNRGLFYYEQGKKDLALTDYNQAIDLNPKLAEAYNNRGLLSSEQGKKDLALADYNQAIDLNPKFAEVYYNRGNLYEKQGKKDLALADYNQAIDLNPKFAEVYYNRGLLSSEQGKKDLALADYNQAIDLNPKFAEAYNNRGLLSSEQGKKDLALADYNQAIDLNPELAMVFYNRGLLYKEQGKLDLALADYNRAIKLNPNNADAYTNRGNLYEEQGKLDLALADYNQALKLNPELAMVFYNRGLLYHNQEKTELALADYNQALKLDSEYATAYSIRGNLYAEQGKMDLALEDLRKAQQLYTSQGNTAGAERVSNFLSKLQQQPNSNVSNFDPNSAISFFDTNIFSNIDRIDSINSNDANTHFDRGLTYFSQKKWDLAINEFNKTISLNPEYTSAYVNRGELYLRQGKAQLALVDFNRALELNPNFAGAYFNRGNLYYDQGKLELAIADYNQALSLNSEFTSAYVNRGNLYSKQGKLELALADYNQAISLDPNDADAYFNRGHFYYDQGKLELALADFNQVISLDPKYANAYYNRGLLYHEQGKPDLAIADYDRAIRLNPEYVDAYYNRGLLYKNQRKIDLALADFHKVLELNPDDADAYYNCGVIYFKQGKTEEARNDLQIAQQLYISQGNSSGEEAVANLLKKTPQ